MRLLWSFALVVLLAACTSQQRTRTFGGEEDVALPAGEKLVMATWKGDSLWFLTRPMRAGETAERYRFAESSAFGVLEGVVVVREHKSNEQEAQ